MWRAALSLRGYRHWRRRGHLLLGPGARRHCGEGRPRMRRSRLAAAEEHRSSGTIFAHARRGEPERLEVSIKDDGIGMASFREGSLGYGLVRSLVQQIGGTIAVQSDPGLAVTISFPACCDRALLGRATTASPIKEMKSRLHHLLLGRSVSARHFVGAKHSHSMTSSARARKDAGSVVPRARAALTFTTSWYAVGACTGRSAGFAPFRMRST